MDKYIIDGGEKLYGRVSLQSAKNTVLPLLAAAVLTDEQVKIRGIPMINDVENMIRILTEVGCRMKRQKDCIVIDSSNAVSHEIPASLTKELRSSVFMLGSVLTRFQTNIVFINTPLLFKWLPGLDSNQCIVESKSTVLPLHHLAIW